MSGSSIPTNPIEKERLTIARNVLTDCQALFILHRRVCRQCREITPIQNRYCPEGYEMVKAVRRSMAALDALTEPPQPQADTLF